ncbi:transglutaminase family protein [Novosphingobium sp. G106]|uniref:transglutaminase-like domain-containing protein n=1 Tax=Novosphingobium sp. G106 TaxID=2849500 RepID=UPI001C2D78E3|nr:transglutaminase family protein [Novosphingobium sp. G106]MBV1687770.1 transglutaminase family protein [Novosphingobium sp. G106]
MLIKAGFDIEFETTTRVPLTALLSIHPSRNRDLLTPHRISVSPDIAIYDYLDAFGNLATRLTLPEGGARLRCEFLIEDSGRPDLAAPDVPVTPIEELPETALPFLLASRYCETEKLIPTAWQMFGGIRSARGRVEAIVDWVHRRIQFGYHHARCTRTAWEGYNEQVGVCRDFAHLAVTLCRAVNIPARYCTGYLGDIGVPPVDAPMDFSAWFEVFVDGGWYTYDARHNEPRIGRIVMARGRDATDVAITTAFGPAVLKKFEVTTDEVASEPDAVRQAA